MKILLIFFLMITIISCSNNKKVLNKKIEKKEQEYISNFNDIVERITQRNVLRSFPDINEIPN